MLTEHKTEEAAGDRCQEATGTRHSTVICWSVYWGSALCQALCGGVPGSAPALGVQVSWKKKKFNNYTETPN